jgi:uncharacterized membrane protein
MLCRRSFSPILILTALLVQGEGFADTGNPLYLLTDVGKSFDDAYDIDAQNYDINNSGQIVGRGISIKKEGCTLPTFYKDGVMTGVGYVPGAGCWYGSASAINDLGQMAEIYATELAPAGPFGLGIFHAFFYDGANLVDLGTMGGYHSVAFDINNSGQAEGSVET